MPIITKISHYLSINLANIKRTMISIKKYFPRFKLFDLITTVKSDTKINYWH